MNRSSFLKTALTIAGVAPGLLQSAKANNVAIDGKETKEGRIYLYQSTFKWAEFHLIMRMAKAQANHPGFFFDTCRIMEFDSAGYQFNPNYYFKKDKHPDIIFRDSVFSRCWIEFPPALGDLNVYCHNAKFVHCSIIHEWHTNFLLKSDDKTSFIDSKIHVSRQPDI